MKKRLLVLMGLIPLMALAQDGKFTISGKVAGNEYCGVLLARFVKSTGQLKDTTFVVNGQFSFSGMVNNERQMAQVIVYGLHEQSMLFYLEPGTIEIDHSNNNLHYAIGGTPLNQELQQFHALLNAMLDSVNAKKEEGKKLTLYHKEIQLLKLSIVKNYIQQHPASMIALDDLNTFGALVNNADELELVYNLFTPELKASDKGIELLAKIKKMRAPQG